MDLTITYHSGAKEEWGAGFKENGGRIICKNIFFILRNNFLLFYLIYLEIKFVLLIRVAAVKVNPRSIKHTEKLMDCESTSPLEIPADDLHQGEKLAITYSYTVKFLVSDNFHILLVFKLEIYFTFLNFYKEDGKLSRNIKPYSFIIQT